MTEAIYAVSAGWLWVILRLMKNTHLPITIKLLNQPCLMVGGGETALRKVQSLLNAQARVTVIADSLCESLQQLVSENQIRHESGSMNDLDISIYRLIFAASDNHQLNQQVSIAALALNIPVNVVDQPDLCSFTMPSIINRSPVQIAISTAGNSPVLARLLKSRLEPMIPASYGRLAGLLGRFRQQAKEQFPDISARRHFWETILHGPIAELLYSGREPDAAKALEESLAHPQSLPQGDVALVGCGPGDPDLLTFRALRLMQQADVVLYDRLVAPVIVDLVRKDAERIYVGKKRDQHTLSQENINDLLVRLAREGKRVVRLKGGDPFIFGRGGEEISTLSSEKITFQVVPGITAASGCASYAGIPLTHRDYAQSCIFVTGHLQNGSINLNWDSLVNKQQTIVIYMGLIGLENICRELISHGMPAEMPAALIRQGTTIDQVVIISTLDKLPELVDLKAIKPPSLIIIGEVVKLHRKLGWFNPEQ